MLQYNIYFFVALFVLAIMELYVLWYFVLRALYMFEEEINKTFVVYDMQL